MTAPDLATARETFIADSDLRTEIAAVVSDAAKGDGYAQHKAAIARSRLRAAVLAALDAGMTEVEAANLAGVTRMTVRAWRKSAG